ncbi:hypothetical protein DCS_07104 [Drechmeria coniospora]|uniref:Uncharacterized protein n=1 Tax=Drechmeria coniospora TaxID=98403 RepID=A0A151GDF6_DRECN|nr:hypothetical protein DCS_07104 [Drechmeria coniospora]KYK55142.1 hypothetical protein DCS_07104 [Drechmeria coniospora]
MPSSPMAAAVAYGTTPGPQHASRPNLAPLPQLADSLAPLAGPVDGRPDRLLPSPSSTRLDGGKARPNDNRPLSNRL